MRWLLTGKLQHVVQRRRMHAVRGGHVFGRVRLHCLQELHPGLFLARQRVPVQRLLSRNVWDGLRSGFMLELFRWVLLYRRDDGLPAVRGWHVRKGERHGGVPGMPRWDVRDERGDAGTRGHVHAFLQGTTKLMFFLAVLLLPSRHVRHRQAGRRVGLHGVRCRTVLDDVRGVQACGLPGVRRRLVLAALQGCVGES